MSKHYLAPDQGLQLLCAAPSCRMLSGDAVCGHMESVVLLLVVCIRNQRLPLLEWEADVGEEFSWLQQFFSFFMPERWALSHSISLPPGLSPSAAYIHPLLLSLFLLCFWHTLYLKLFLNQLGDSFLQWVSSSLSKQRKFFLGFTIQQLDTKTLHPSDVK